VHSCHTEMRNDQPEKSLLLVKNLALPLLGAELGKSGLAA
jgi:hypothetical protein